MYFAYRLGEVDGVTKYSNILVDKCQFIDIKKSVSIQAYGYETQYDAVMLVENNSNSRLIDKFTKIWVNSVPLDANSNTGYRIIRESNNSDGIITFYIQSTTDNYDELWYEYNGVIYRTEVLYNSENKIVQTPKNMYFPIDKTTKVWYIEPDNSSSTNGLIKLKSTKSTDNSNLYYFE